MDIWLGPGGLWIFIQICLHSWMRNKLLYCIIVCDKSYTLFSSSPASYGFPWTNREVFLGRCAMRSRYHQVKGWNLAHLQSPLMRVTMPSLPWWKQMRTDDGKRLDSMSWTSANHLSFYSSQMMCQIRQAKLTYWRFISVCFCCAQWTWLWL